MSAHIHSIQCEHACAHRDMIFFNDKMHGKYNCIKSKQVQEHCYINRSPIEIASLPVLKLIYENIYTAFVLQILSRIWHKHTYTI